MPRRLREKLQDVTKRASTPAALNAKVEIRRKVLQVIGPENCRVFDAYAGTGTIYDHVWKEAASYTGCDVEFYPDDRMCFVADNRRVLRAIDLDDYNVFDLDAYGSPWEQLLIVASRRVLQPDETLGIVITEGQGMKLKLGGMSLALSQLAGVRHYLPGLATAQDELIDRAIRRIAELMHGTVVRRWQAAQRTGSVMHYIGVVMKGEAAA